MFLRVSASWRKVSNSFIVTRVRESWGGGEGKKGGGKGGVGRKEWWWWMYIKVMPGKKVKMKKVMKVKKKEERYIKNKVVKSKRLRYKGGGGRRLKS